MKKVFTHFGGDEESRREELIRTIEHSVEKLTLGELEALTTISLPKIIFENNTYLALSCFSSDEVISLKTHTLYNGNIKIFYAYSVWDSLFI